MHKQSRPRTPRYWPRMKVRGARRRRRAPVDRMARAFDNLGLVALDWQVRFAAAFINFRPRVMLGAGAVPPKGYARIQMETDEITGGQITAADLDRIGESIMKEEHGSDR